MHSQKCQESLPCHADMPGMIGRIKLAKAHQILQQG
jgi:hypothetical protein